MNLEGQGARAVCRSANRSGLDDRGYILVALLVGMAIASVWMAAALPAWRQQVIREREAELIFRGEQYARAIWLYQQKNNQQYPQSFDDLISQHVLRHKWKDPITDDDFLPLPAGFCQTGVPGGVPGGGPGGFPGGGPGGNPQRGGPAGGGTGPGTTGGTTPGRLSGPTVAPPSLGQGTPGAQPGRGTPATPGQFGQPQQPQSGICGVVSKSDKASIKIYQQQKQYNLWRFTTQVALMQFNYNRMKYGGGVAPPMGVPTIPGGRQNPPGGPGGFQPGGPAGPGGRNPRGGPGGGAPGSPIGPGMGQPGPGRGNPPTTFPTGPGRGRGGA